MVKESFDKTGQAPEWIKALGLGDLKGYLKIEQGKFFVEDEETGINLHASGCI